jgi:hypothetical protein
MSFPDDGGREGRCSELTWLLARQDFIAISSCEIFRSYTIMISESIYGELRNI